MATKANKVTKKTDPAVYAKIGETIKARIDYNNSIIKASEDRIEYIEETLLDNSVSRDEKTTLAIELAELKLALFFKKDDLESWHKRGIQNELENTANEKIGTETQTEKNLKKV